MLTILSNCNKPISHLYQQAQLPKLHADSRQSIVLSKARKHIAPVSGVAARAASLPTCAVQVGYIGHRLMSKTAPTYLSDECQLISSVCLRSSDTRTCTVHWSHNHFGILATPLLSLDYGTDCSSRLDDHTIVFNILKDC